MNYWLVKSEPFKYSWDHFVSEGEAVWDGIRNYQARNNLMQMKIDDLVLFYHSNEGKEVIGLAKVSREFYPDPTTEEKGWVVVNLVPVAKFPKTVTLAEIKADKRLQDMLLIRNSRLSVIPVRLEEFDLIVAFAHEV